MDNCNYSIKSIFMLVMVASGILTINGGSYSSVSLQRREPSSIIKSLSKINIPQVPEFPKLAARPAKNPLSAPSPSTNHNSHQATNHQQQPPQSHHNIQQQSVLQLQNENPSLDLPTDAPSIPQEEMEYAPIYESNLDISDEDHGENQDYSNEPFHENSVDDVDLTFHSYDPVSMINEVSSNNDSSISKLASSSDHPPEKMQDASTDFAMPMHVINILNALGSGGSLAQASKPEKDGAGQGYTTANAIGYATGDNATVTASVSNKMELNTQTVILTESASASASSMSNGTAFSQANLASNGYTSQLGPGGSGWKMTNKIPVFA